MLKLVWTAILAVALFSGISVKGQTLTLDYFNASPDGSDVLISWEVPDVSGITNFKVFRKMENASNYVFLDHVQPNGQTAYQYLDNSIYKGNAMNISYRLQVYKGNTVFTYYTTILHNPTSVQRTWGSIKNMFK